MEAVAKRLSCDQVSSTQRSVLISRFNDMRRRVNEIDGVVGSEGRRDAVGLVGAGQKFYRRNAEGRRADLSSCAPSAARDSDRAPSRLTEPARPVQEASTPKLQGNIVDL